MYKTLAIKYYYKKYNQLGYEDFLNKVVIPELQSIVSQRPKHVNKCYGSSLEIIKEALRNNKLSEIDKFSAIISATNYEKNINSLSGEPMKKP